MDILVATRWAKELTPYMTTMPSGRLVLIAFRRSNVRMARA